MAKSLSTRFGLQRWSADSDTQQRSEFDNNAAQLDSLAAKAGHGTISARPAASAAWADGLWLITDATGGGVVGTLYYCDGTTWTTYAPRKQGLATNRPAASLAQQHYYKTDTDLLSIDDGAAWHDFPSKAVTDAAYMGSAGGTLTGELVLPDLKVTGLTGSVQASRYVGATTSGAPSTGAHLLGDWIIDLTGKIFICTTAGTPGTWTQVGSASVTAANPATLGYTTIEAISGVGNALIANNILYMKFRPIADITITSLRYLSANASGNCDVGIYADSAGAPGARLASTGSAVVGAVGVVSKTIASTALTGGTAYWLAFVADNTTATFFSRVNNGPAAADVVKVQAATFPLPATATPVASAASSLTVPTVYILT